MNINFDDIARRADRNQSVPSGFFDSQGDSILIAVDRYQRRVRNRILASATSCLVVAAAIISFTLSRSTTTPVLSLDEQIAQYISSASDEQISQAAAIADAEMLFDTDYDI